MYEKVSELNIISSMPNVIILYQNKLNWIAATKTDE